MTRKQLQAELKAAKAEGKIPAEFNLNSKTIILNAMLLSLWIVEEMIDIAKSQQTT